jgi:cytochrome c553
MKKYFILITIAICGHLLSQCHSSKKAMAAVPKLTYANDLQTTILGNCSPCHIPAKGGNKKPYDNYANVSHDIDAMLQRIQLNPTDKGFMPFRGKKLSDSTIAIFQKWKADGMLEK